MGYFSEQQRIVDYVTRLAIRYPGYKTTKQNYKYMKKYIESVAAIGRDVDMHTSLIILEHVFREGKCAFIDIERRNI